MLAINAMPPSKHLVADKGYEWHRVATRFNRNINTFTAKITIAAFVTWWQ